MILRIIIILALVVTAVLVLAVSKPKTFHRQRSITIKASPDKIFALVNDLHRGSDWSPQDQDDHSIRRTFTGAAAGAGAASEWQGTGSTGQGRMLITESVPTWDFDGTNVFLLKLMSVFVSRDRVMGKHFETGLENLKAAAER